MKSDAPSRMKKRQWAINGRVTQVTKDQIIDALESLEAAENYYKTLLDNKDNKIIQIRVHNLITDAQAKLSNIILERG